MEKKTPLKMMKRTAGILALSLAVSSNANAVWFGAKIVQVVPNAGGDGDVTVQIVAGANENRFSKTEFSRVVINGSDAGANKIMATALTAITLDVEITVNVPNRPSPTAQILTGMRLRAP